MIFLSVGLKYHDKTVTTNNINDGTASENGCPTVKCEMKAPDIAKKNPA